MGKSKNSDASFIMQGSILAIASIISRIVGLIYRIPLTAIIGKTGNDYYGTAYSIYNIILIMSSFSLPLAVSKLVASRMGNGRAKDAFRVFKGALGFAIVSGGLGALLLYFGADYFTGTLLKTPLSAIALKVLAPTVFVVALLGVFRGFFQGLNTMMPSAFSQVAEQILNAIVSVVAAYMLYSYGKRVGAVLGDADAYAAAYGAAGGTLGTAAGAFLAFLFVLFVYLVYRKRFKKRMRRDHHREQESYGHVLKMLLLTIFPILLSTIVYNVSTLIDQGVFKNIASLQGYSAKQISEWWGVQAKPLNGAQRLKLMHDMFNMDGASKFHFDWKDLVKSGLSVKDAIAPTAFAFKNSRTFQMGGIFCAASFLSITASDISDQLLKDFLDMDSSQIVTMHIQSVDQNRAIKTVKRTITELDRSKIEEQKKAIRAGYDIDIIPSDLATYGRDAKALLKELQSQNERMFLVTFLVLNTGRTEQELENNVFQASSIAQKHNCNLCRLDFQQEQGLMSSLPLADCQIEIQRGLTTSSTAIFIPFTTQELYQSGKESLYYGLNALSNNLIMVDRKKLKNPNGLILGTPGSGKSFSAKREIANAFLVTDDDIIINDPEGEYSPLVNRLKGQVIKISPNSTQFVNPMDINANYSEEDNPLSLKADFILSLCELVVGGKEGLLPVEKTVIDRCVHLIYRKYFANPCPENMPILEDLYNALLQQEEKEAHHVATALEIYVKGSLNLFNHRTNVNVNNRIVCYDIKELGKQMKKLGMLIVQDQVWGRVTANRSSGKSTRYYMDEMHLLLKEEQTAAYSVEIWKRFRKWGGIPTGLTQNVKDLLSSREVENIFENSDMIIMLNQAAGDRQILAKQLNISPHQLSYVTHSGEGEGLLFFGNVILPFVDRFPTDLELYRIMTTKLGEVSEGAQK